MSLPRAASTFALAVASDATIPILQFGECTQVLRGRDWIGVFDHPANSLDFYSDEGKALATWDLSAMGFPSVQAVAAHDDLLALGQASSNLVVLKVDTSRCPQEGGEAPLPLAVP